MLRGRLTHRFYDRLMVEIEVARHQWEDGRRAVDRLRSDRAAFEEISRQVEIVTVELNRRIGQVFTMEQLVGFYAEADRWVIDVFEEALPDGWSRAAMSIDAAFQSHACRASDYRP